MEFDTNLLTVDLEEWFVVEALSNHFSREEWDKQVSTVVRNSRRLLELFRSHDVEVTWFVLGWVAERYPELVREIALSGHEIACHSYNHSLINHMTPEEFRKDTERAIEAISRAVGVRPIGYRAPSWSVDDTTPWAFEIMAELGFEYDSSIYPIKHDIYGIPGGPRRPFRMNLESGRSLHEFPASAYRLLRQNIPFGGGGFLRHSPYWYSRRCIRRSNEHGLPVVVYIHPWEIDPDPPAVQGLTMLQRYRTYGSTSLFYRKLDKLLRDFAFTSVAAHLKGSRKKRRIGFHVD